MSISGPFSSFLSRFWAIWGRFGGDLGSFLARSAPRVLSGAHFGAIWGDFGALRCCGRRSFLLCFLRPPLPWQRDDITGTFWGGTPHFFSLPPPPPLHPTLLPFSRARNPPCKECPRAHLSSLHEDGEPYRTRCLCTSSSSLHKESPWGSFLGILGAIWGAPGIIWGQFRLFLGAIQALFE